MAVSLSLKLASDQQVNALWSKVTLGAVVIIAILVHSYNMFGYPLYLGDEGIYMSQAYAVAKLGQITPYTYWYDHAPAGWLFIAAWSILTGGFQTFGTAINGGRVFMLLIHIASLMLLFDIMVHLTANIAAATATSLFYALSPLTIIYGRMVLLDNIMIFWVLLATALFLSHGGKLWPLCNGAFCFGIAVLTKEIAVFLIPAFLFGLWTLIEKNHVRFARIGWVFTAFATISLYPLYAALRKELFTLDLSSPLANNGSSVSLLGSVLWQLNRSGGMPWDPASDFYHFLMTDWIIKDPWLLGIGVAATLWNLIRNDHSQRLIAILSLFAIIGIGHGNPVLNFYVLTVLPFLALNAGVAVVDIASLTKSQAALPTAAVVAVLAIGWINLRAQPDVFNLNLTTIQQQALDWTRTHVPADAQIITDDDLWVDLRDGGSKYQDFPGAHSHWKVANDQAVYNDLFHNDWKLFDYLIMTPELDEIFKNGQDKLTYKAYSNSTSVASFSVGNATVEIRKVNHAGPAVNQMVAQSYEHFLNRYVDKGQVRPAHGYTNARDQAAAMLMAVWMDDRETFDEMWSWTFLHLQSETGLLYHTNQPGVEPRSTTAADTDLALALLLAERRWSDASYGRHAKKIIQAIWEYEVVEIEDAPYLAAGDWAVSKDQVIFAPAAFTPYAYHFFAQADPDHNWWYLLDTNYQLLADVVNNPLGEERSAGLPPAYVGIDRRTGEVVPNPSGAPTHGNTFDEQAAEVYWRVGLDAQWHDDGRADSFLEASSFLNDEWETKSVLAARYTHMGKPLTQEESLILYSMVLPKFLIEDSESAHELYATKFVTAFAQTHDGGQWGEILDITQERWAWLATGLYTNALQYQWGGATEATRPVPKIHPY